MYYLLKTVWAFHHSYVDPADSRNYGDIYHGRRWQFNDATRLVELQDETTHPQELVVDVAFGNGASGQTPTDYSRPTSDEFYVWLNGAQRTGYFHDGNGGVRTVSSGLVLTPTVVDATCFGANTASIVVAVTGLNGPFTYSWSDGVTTRDRSLVPAGTYRLTATDVPSGAVARATIVVGQNPQLQVLVQKVRGEVTLTVSGGIAPYAYAWSDGATTRDRTGLADGIYTCTITDAVGCPTVLTVQVTNNLFYFSRNPVTLALDAGAAYRLDPTTKPHLSFLCEVWVEPEYLSGTFVQVGGILEQPADRAGRTTFEVQALLDGFLAPHVPPVGATGTLRADPLFRRFYLQYAERFGDTPVRAGTTVLARHYVVLGGLNAYESRRRTFFDEYQPTVRPFLTWQPPVKPALPDQPEYLYYLVTQEPAGFRFQVRVQYTDGTSEVVNLGGRDNVRLFEVYCRPVGFDQLGLAVFEQAQAKRVQWWEIFVTSPDETQVLSETRRYVLDRRVFPRRRYFLFATSLGGMATYAATGEALLEAEVSGEEAARTLPPDADPLLGDTAVQTRQLRPVVKVASGPRTRAQMEAAQDLLLSRRVLLLDRAGTRWLPGFVKAKTVTLLDESKAVPTQEFEFYLTTEQLFTPGLGPEPVTYARPLL